MVIPGCNNVQFSGSCLANHKLLQIVEVKPVGTSFPVGKRTKFVGSRVSKKVRSNPLKSSPKVHGHVELNFRHNETTS